MSPRITIIVPTRERCDTLLWALKTCVTQDYDNLEILVSDNASTDETRAVVESYDDPRIRYINPGRRLGMSEHWEFAFSHVNQGHVGVIGDDDGIMPGGITFAADVLQRSESAALIWPVYSFYWPGYVESALAGHLSMKLVGSEHVELLDAGAMLAEVSSFRRHVHWLPSPYWGLVSSSAVKMASNQQGRFFNSMTPDIYSGIALGSVLSSYVHVSRPVTLSGESRHSTAGSQISAVGDHIDGSPIKQFLAESRLEFHPRLTYAANIHVLTGESLLQVRDHCADDVPDLDVRSMLRAALRHPDHLFNPLGRPATEAALREIAAREGLTPWFKQELRDSHSRQRARYLAAAARNLLRGSPLHACSAGNIFGATLEADALANRSRGLVSARAQNVRGRLSKLHRGIKSVRERSKRVQAG